MLFALNLFGDMCQLHPSKTEKEKRELRFFSFFVPHTRCQFLSMAAWLYEPRMAAKKQDSSGPCSSQVGRQ